MRPIRMPAVIVVAAAVLSACAGAPVEPSPDPSASAVCARLVSAVPATVAGARMRSSSSTLVRQWGDPAIVLRCGVGRPAAMTPTSRCDLVEGVGWFAEDLDDGYRFTTIGRSTFVEVTVPGRYAPEADALVDLAPAVATVPQVQPCV